MARIAFSALLNGIQGSVGGSTFQKNKSGFTLKNKPVSADTNTIKQNNARLFLSSLISLWQSFTDAQRNEWNIFANFYPTYNRNNRNVMLSGYQLFLKYNLIRMHAGFNPLTVIVYGTITKFSTSAVFYWHNHELIVSVDPNFDAASQNILLMCGSPRSTGYPTKVKSYKLIPLTDIFEHYLYITQEYFEQFASVPGLGLYIPYKLTFFYMNMPVVQEGPFDIQIINPVV